MLLRGSVGLVLTLFGALVWIGHSRGVSGLQDLHPYLFQMTTLLGVFGLSVLLLRVSLRLLGELQRLAE
jgi:hypothetical protein